LYVAAFLPAALVGFALSENVCSLSCLFPGKYSYNVLDRIQHENPPPAVNGNVKSSGAGPRFAGTRPGAEFRNARGATFNQLLWAGDNPDKVAFMIINLHAYQALLTGDKAIVWQYGEIYRIAAAAEALQA
jgi:hypothetical protein